MIRILLGVLIASCLYLFVIVFPMFVRIQDLEESRSHAVAENVKSWARIAELEQTLARLKAKEKAE